MKALSPRLISIPVLIVVFLTAVICFGQDTAEQILAKGVEYAADGKFQEGKEEFEKALKVDPLYGSAKRYLKLIAEVDEGKIKTNAAIRYFKGVTYGEKGQLDQAIADFTKAIEIDSKFAMPYGGRAYAFFLKAQYDQGIADCTKAIEIDPELAMAYINRGIAYADKGQYGQAISDFSKAIELNPRDALAYINRGYAYAHKGQYDQAVSDYTKAIEINPRYALAYGNRGISYFFKKEYEKAWDDVHKAQSLGHQVHPGFLNELREASARER